MMNERSGAADPTHRAVPSNFSGNLIFRGRIIP
jgi:hypothetical protein